MFRDFRESDVVSYWGATAAWEIFGVTEEGHPVMEGKAWTYGGGAVASSGVGKGSIIHG
jgi:hypothetical protein